MKNKKGFTLVELLVVIALIAVITTSISVAAFNMLQSQQETMAEDVIENLENASCTYAEVIDLRDTCDAPNDCTKSIKVADLIANGYLDEEDYSDYKNGEVIVSWDNEGLKKCTYNKGEN